MKQKGSLTEEGLTFETFPRVTIRYFNAEKFSQISQEVLQVWQQTLGIKVTLSPVRLACPYRCNLTERRSDRKRSACF